MFNSFNTEQFGLYMKKLRKSLNLSQANVVKNASINIDTLRRIENGYVIPKYETLEYLSKVYKMNITKIFCEYSYSNSVYDFYLQMDSIINHFDSNQVNKLSSIYEDILNNIDLNDFISQVEVKQLGIIVNGVTHYYNDQFEKAYESFLNAMKLSISKYDINNFNRYNYTSLEKRILLMLSLSLRRLENYTLVEGMLLFLLDKFDDVELNSNNKIFMKLKILLNLSYLYHVIDDNESALHYSDCGINLALKHYTNYYLSILYYRRGIAKFILMHDDYMEDLRNSIFFLGLTNQHDLIERYKKITFDTYNLSIE